jgi:hypothetical protein
MPRRERREKGDGMTEIAERTLEIVRTELEEAEEAVSVLEAEARAVPQTLITAANEEEGELAALALKGANPSPGSRYAAAMDRRDALPGLLWAARLRAKRLQVELWTLEMDEDERANSAASEEANKLSQRERVIAEKKADALSRANHHYERRRDRNRWRGEVRREISALEHQGPDPLPTASPLRRIS